MLIGKYFIGSAISNFFRSFLPLINEANGDVIQDRMDSVRPHDITHLLVLISASRYKDKSHPLVAVLNKICLFDISIKYIACNQFL